MTSREALGFEGAATKTFGFLAESHGFRKTFSSERKVRYESDKVYVEINHGDYDYEISITFGRRDTPEPERFDFTLFLRSANPTLEKALGERIADRPETVRDTLDKLAAALRDEGKDILTGNDAVFERMKSVRWWQFKPEALGGEKEGTS